MPKSRKRKTSAKKRKKPAPQKHKLTARGRVFDDDLPIIPLLESHTVSEFVPTKLDMKQVGNIVDKYEIEETEMEDFADVSEERSSIISIVKGLEGQVETAFKLKEVLEAELETTQTRLSEELTARVQLEAELDSLKGQADLADQLREDISFAEEERNNFANELAETQSQLAQATKERDSLAEQLSETEANVKELEGEKMAFEAHVMNLKDRIIDANHLREELAKVTEAHQDLRKQSHDLARRLEASETLKNTVERKLANTYQSTRTLRQEVEVLQEKVTVADSLAADLRIQLEDQQATNRELIETNTHLENKVKMVAINYESAKKELDIFKNALRDIRGEAARTSGRVRQRYFKPNDKTVSSRKKAKTAKSRSR